MPTNHPLFTDRPLPSGRPAIALGRDHDDTGAFLESLAHAALLLILLGAFLLSGQRAGAPTATPAETARVVADASPSPASTVHDL